MDQAWRCRGAGKRDPALLDRAGVVRGLLLRWSSSPSPNHQAESNPRPNQLSQFCGLFVSELAGE